MFLSDYEPELRPSPDAVDWKITALEIILVSWSGKPMERHKNKITTQKYTVKKHCNQFPNTSTRTDMYVLILTNILFSTAASETVPPIEDIAVDSGGHNIFDLLGNSKNEAGSMKPLPQFQINPASLEVLNSESKMAQRLMELGRRLQNQQKASKKSEDDHVNTVLSEYGRKVEKRPESHAKKMAEERKSENLSENREEDHA